VAVAIRTVLVLEVGLLYWWFSLYPSAPKRAKTFLTALPFTVPLPEVDVLSKKNYKWNVGKEVEARKMVDFSRGARFLLHKKISS
jgi:hypothetical protein